MRYCEGDFKDFPYLRLSSFPLCLLVIIIPGKTDINMKKANKKSTNVLIIEDSFFFSRWLYAEFFKIEGLEIVGYASNYKDASLMIENLEIDIAIIDIKLEEGYGTNLIKSIKSKKENIVIIVFSNHVECKAECLKLGADYFFDKSHEFDELVKLISFLN